MRLTAAIRREGAWFVAQCLEVEVASQGRTIEESVDNLREALELHFEGEPPPAEPLPQLLVTTVEIATRPAGSLPRPSPLRLRGGRRWTRLGQVTR